ncbi:hypothetical protein [Halalkalibacter akibai]|uniref:Uncharacterized protein n=1 Tax=Halalkalibacter akibai (strain ATCC 43226 / DSM 21942 / CIP 109018 / JCM 9157 / 1139) TaxID=1236973 RepID=W4QTH2_HALA3|nr:hypothetical protein [Halalkalibacter akibai]GAE34624.1 hypothetical protein JCM9157_1694 [Halalkalibacter akibai JCM 9157]
MTKEEVKTKLEQLQMEDILELVVDAEKGYLEELELVESIGLVYDRELNEALIQVLKELGVKIDYVVDEEEQK